MQTLQLFSSHNQPTNQPTDQWKAYRQIINEKVDLRGRRGGGWEA